MELFTHIVLQLLSPAQKRDPFKTHHQCTSGDLCILQHEKHTKLIQTLDPKQSQERPQLQQTQQHQHILKELSLQPRKSHLFKNNTTQNLFFCSHFFALCPSARRLIIHTASLTTPTLGTSRVAFEKENPNGDHRFWSIFPFTNRGFKVPFFDP